MLDETLDLLIDEVAKLVPDVVLGAIFLVTGLLTAMLGVATLLGVATVGWSPRFGGVLTAVGALLVVSVVVWWYR
ncbi:hypothetical protein [Halorubrum ezzemoulense]|uniref:Major facilitator superfamily (MFS) profile domain-containing protein n=1 Tax=Halorubrum ezzemoulense TaxID=337243 RepID=A0A256K3Q6_HALEZ|nr:hypothetical protein [Halorubrum ezzemoulense]OYR75436.1 hypothetical protein DJ76_03400 [Halorubrum ezzemoulense]